MSNTVEQFRAAVIEGLNRLRSVAGTNPDREYDRAIAFVHALPAPVIRETQQRSEQIPPVGYVPTMSMPRAAREMAVYGREVYGRGGVAICNVATINRECSDEELANGTCKPIAP